MVKKPPPPPSSSSEDNESTSSSDEQQQSINENPSRTPTKTKEESSDESEEESSDDDQKPESNTKTPNPSTSASVPSKSLPESESESESSEESESDSASEAAKLVSPISSKPMAVVETPVSKTIDAEKSNGKAREKPLFQRIWSLDDEIAILKAMAEFEGGHGTIKLNASAIGEFHAFVKDSLSLKVSDTQLVEKMRRLKKRYLGLDARAKKSKKALKFAKAHDQNVYELSKKVWGEGKDVVDEDQHKVRVKLVKGNSKGGSFKRGYPFLKDAVVKMRSSLEAIERIGPGKGTFLEKKVKKQEVLEIEHSIREMELLKETVKMVMEGLERAKD